MKAERETIQILNTVLRIQLTAINQFFLHARMLGNWGLEKLNEKDYKKSITAMKQADNVIERILFLEGLPNLQDLGKLLIGENVPEILNYDLELHLEERTGLLTAISHCETSRDYVSRELLEELLEECEQHIDWSESQLWLIENSGLENYLQSQM